MSKARLWKKRHQMWHEDPHCHYCGKRTLLIDDLHLIFPIPPLAATIDHLRPRHHPGRLEPIEHGERRTVLACWQCNNDRDRRELAEKPREFFYQTGGARPLSLKSIEELKSIEMVLAPQLLRAQQKLQCPQGNPYRRGYGRNRRRLQSKVHKLDRDLGLVREAIARRELLEPFIETTKIVLALRNSLRVESGSAGMEQDSGSLGS